MLARLSQPCWRCEWFKQKLACWKVWTFDSKVKFWHVELAHTWIHLFLDWEQYFGMFIGQQGGWMFLQLKYIYIYINMFTGAEHEQIYPGRYRWICFGKGEWPGRTATSGWCNNLRRYSMYTICKCLILDNRLLISLIWGTSLIWRTLKYSLLLSCWLSAEKFLASAQRKENGKATVPQIRFVFAEARNWVWQGVQQQLSGESCFKSWTRRQWLSCMYFEHNMMTKPCNSW